MIMRCYFCGRIIAEIYKMSHEDETLAEIPCAKCKKINIIDFKYLDIEVSQNITMSMY